MAADFIPAVLEALPHYRFILCIEANAFAGTSTRTGSRNKGLAGNVYKMSTFCKNEDCPASEELLAFQVGDMPVHEGAGIRRHLAVCEFCAAEVEFYTNYPQANDNVEADEIPRPLFELAEALLNKKQDDAFFDQLMYADD